MIVVTGAAGFIASCLVGKLNEEGYNDLVLVDDFSKPDKKKNYESKKYTELVDRKDLEKWIDKNHMQIQFIYHLGARTDTTEFDKSIFDELNLNYSKTIWKQCVQYGLPLVYASSAATYGGGEEGYDDNEGTVDKLKPLNPYGQSKQDFDVWALEQKEKPYHWIGLKFFNVYGPNEYHKGRMASVVFHGFNQIKETGKIKLFRSHREDYENGKQLRDFVYVKDVCDVCYHFLHHRKDSGIYNLGSGKAQSFLDLANATFKALGKEPNIEFIDIPEDIRDKYQYFTEANMEKARKANYTKTFKNLDEGVNDYVKNYLEESKVY
ncbi:MAG: ADP-glyceromanno-heptose 6-epimerase [Bacteroidia bacterium]|nr:ADP-glyceromanno-heptose 6-epimerase [Bacteroidia bacterium]NNM16006.1 ADP-glyceromanno-heptose 6-epimerase [Bacteroidia bacterium]